MEQEKNLKKIEIRNELNETLKKLGELLLKIRNPANGWYFENALTRLGEAEFWAVKALETIYFKPQEVRKEVKFADKSTKHIASKS
jgi:hypothetical protein